MVFGSKYFVVLVLLASAISVCVCGLPSISPTIRKACSIAKNPRLCMSSLASYPGASHANLTELAVISFKITTAFAEKAIDIAQAVGKHEPSAHVNECVGLLKDALSLVHDSSSAIEHLYGHDLDDVVEDGQDSVTAAQTEVDTCLAGFGKSASSRGLDMVKSRIENVTNSMSNVFAVLTTISDEDESPT